MKLEQLKFLRVFVFQGVLAPSILNQCKDLSSIVEAHKSVKANAIFGLILLRNPSTQCP